MLVVEHVLIVIGSDCSKRSIGCFALVGALLALAASHAAAEPAVGIVEGTQILAGFDTASPGQFTGCGRSPALAAGEKIVDLDYRWHPNGELNPLPPRSCSGWL